MFICKLLSSLLLSSNQSSLLPPTRTRCRDLRRRHQIPNILLQELIVVIQLIVLFLDSLDTIKDLQ